MMQGRLVVVVAVFSCLNGWATGATAAAQKEMKSFSGKFLVSRYLNGYVLVC